MRAFAVRSFGEAAAIHDLPIPAVDGAFLIRVTYAGVNPIDYKLLQQLTPDSKFPFVVGVDFAGVAERVPNEERDLRTGDRVFGIARTYGSYAGHTAVAPGAQAQPVARIPDGVTDEHAAALPVPAITALGSLKLLGVNAGQNLVVMGATGGVGGYAVQMARSQGAHVIATVRGDVEEARRLGAQEVYDTKAGEVIDAIRASHPGGIDAILDLVSGPDAIRRDVEILKPGGAVVSTIHVADIAWFAARRMKAFNISPASNPVSTAEGLTEVVRMLADGAITARIGATVGLDGAADILKKLRNGEVHGKAVIRI